ncbi:MAG: EEP domain-containing protein [Armatimonadetes bacterium]|nr:EEP domain-containing protein [Armatimonadota bacterium]
MPVTSLDAMPPRTEGTLRVVSYNIHSCIGLDRLHSPERIVETLAAFEADVIALQEVETGRHRTGRRDQPQEIAARLGMDLHFHPAVRHPDGDYGIAVLSRLPMERVRAAHLPRLRLPFVEPRVAQVVRIHANGSALSVVNTHLGLLSRERARQALHLRGWLQELCARGPTLLCGDLNATPNSRECRLLNGWLRDVVPAGRIARTFPVNFPISRLDHILVSADVDCVAVAVPRNPLTLAASDHFPVVADVRVR